MVIKEEKVRMEIKFIDRFNDQLDTMMWERKILDLTEIYNIPKLVILLTVIIKSRKNQLKGKKDLFGLVV